MTADWDLLAEQLLRPAPAAPKPLEIR